jgi:hypothetical protein
MFASPPTLVIAYCGLLFGGTSLRILPEFRGYGVRMPCPRDGLISSRACPYRSLCRPTRQKPPLVGKERRLRRQILSRS